jgi:hypothetical protein
MSQNVDFEPLSDAGEAGRLAADAFTDLRRLSAVPVDLSVEIGRARMCHGYLPSREALGRFRQGLGWILKSTSSRSFIAFSVNLAARSFSDWPCTMPEINPHTKVKNICRVIPGSGGEPRGTPGACQPNNLYNYSRDLQGGKSLCEIVGKIRLQSKNFIARAH